MADNDRVVYVLDGYHVRIQYFRDEDDWDSTDEIIRRYGGGRNNFPRLPAGLDEVTVLVCKNQVGAFGDFVCKWSKVATLRAGVIPRRWWQFWKYFQRDTSSKYVDEVVEEACAWIEEALGVDVLVREKLRAIEERVDSIRRDMIARETVAKEIFALEKSSPLEDSNADPSASSRKLKQSDS